MSARRIVSPLAVPKTAGEAAIDLDHLDRMTLGDAVLSRDVLRLFHGQAASVIATLSHLPPDMGQLIHRLKGSARAIGANRVAESAADLEAVLAASEPVAPALALLTGSVTEALRAIDLVLSIDRA